MLKSNFNTRCFTKMQHISYGILIYWQLKAEVLRHLNSYYFIKRVKITKWIVIMPGEVATFWWGIFTLKKTVSTTKREFNFQHSVLRNLWYSVIDLERMNNWVDLGATQWFWTWNESSALTTRPLTNRKRLKWKSNSWEVFFVKNYS